MMATAGTRTRAVVLRRCPSDGLPRPENFEVRELDLAEPGEDQLVVENRFMSVDPSIGRADGHLGDALHHQLPGGTAPRRLGDRRRGPRQRGHPRGLVRAAPARPGVRTRGRGRRGRHGDRSTWCGTASLARCPWPTGLHRLRGAVARGGLQPGDDVVLPRRPVP